MVLTVQHVDLPAQIDDDGLDVVAGKVMACLDAILSHLPPEDRLKFRLNANCWGLEDDTKISENDERIAAKLNKRLFPTQGAEN